MYREKDYNKKTQKKGEKVFPQSRPRVIDGDSVYEKQASPEKRKQPVGNKQSSVVDDVFEEDAYYEKSPKKKKHKQKRKHSLFRKIITVILILLFAVWLFLTLVLNTQSFPKDDAALGITTESTFGVKNIAFFGVDSRDDSDTGRSDAMMIMSFDFFHGKVKMISLLRDTKVAIEDHGETKLNHAYAYGGPALAVKTINQTFHTDIKEYATVNFNQLSEIVDAVGGVTVDLTETELKELNTMLATGELPGEPVASAGSVVLNGTQAINYSRIRHIDSDNARTDRQQEILSGILISVQNMSLLDYPRFAYDFAAIAETSLSALDVMALTPNILRGFEIERYTVPDEEYETDLWGGKDSDGLWYWHYDIEAAANRIHTILYGE